jgi:ABC-type transporter lipoprotein component MlaA
MSILEKRRDSPRRIRMSTRDSLRAALILALALLVAAPTLAQEPRGSSRVEVLGVDQFHQTRSRRGFTAIQYMPDPIEGFNRGSLAVTQPILHWVLRPLAKGFRFVFPAPVRRSISRLSYNLAWPNRFVSLLLEGRPIDAGTETGHFLVNSTVGLAGLFDPASSLGIPTYDEDVGLAFASWGSGPGFYLFIPLMGPSSGRDALGRIFDTALNPATFVPGASWLFNANSLSFRIDAYESFVASNRELYFPLRALWATQRQVKVTRLELTDEDYDRADPEPSLGVLLLKTDPAFVAKRVVGSAQTPATGKALPYSLWLQPKPAALVYVVPGIGAHRGSGLPQFLAQKAFERGYSVAIVSNPFNFEFIERGLSGPYPGSTPEDAEDLYAALQAIDTQLETRHPSRITSRRLLGYSLGAIESLFLAASQAKRPAKGLRFERVVAVNPPVDLRYAARNFDGYFDAPLRWPEAERDERVMRAVMKAYLMTQPKTVSREGFPFTRTESEFLVGFYARVGLIDALTSIRGKGDPVIEIRDEKDTRGRALSGLVNQTTLDRYAGDLLVPYLQKKTGLSPDQLSARASLRVRGEFLRGSDLVRVFTNSDDFIVDDSGRSWLRETLGDRVTIFPGGGHLGNLYLKEVHGRVIDALDTGASSAGVEPPSASTAAR